MTFGQPEVIHGFILNDHHWSKTMTAYQIEIVEHDGELPPKRSVLPEVYRDHKAANNRIIGLAESMPRQRFCQHHTGQSVAYRANQLWSDGSVRLHYVEFTRIPAITGAIYA